MGNRVQLALKVTDLTASIDFYTKAFGTEPAKIEAGYANFAIADPPLKLVLIEGPAGGQLDHLGVEMESTDDVATMSRTLVSQGLQTEQELGVECCYARQDKVWANDPDGAEWEWYTVLGDSPVMSKDPACC